MKRILTTFLILTATILTALANWPVPAADGRTQFPTTGVLRIPVVLVDFADMRFSWDYRSQVSMALNGFDGYPDRGGQYTAKRYFKDNSGGRLEVLFEVTGVTLPLSSVHFDKGGTRLLTEFLQLAVAQDPSLDFARYDADQDGMLDTVIFIYAGKARIFGSNWFSEWTHHVDYTSLMERMGCPPLSLHGKLMDRCAMIPQRFTDGSPVNVIGPVCHEVGHVLGLPDMATLSPSIPSRTPEVWSVMDTGCLNDGGARPPLFSAYERWYCRWLEPQNISLLPEPQNISLHSAGTDYYSALKMDLPVEIEQEEDDQKKEFLLFESRSALGWDSGLPGSGMVIWHVLYNPSSWEFNVVNTYGNTRVSPAYSDVGNRDVLWPSAQGINWYLPELSDELLPRLKYTEPFTPVILDAQYDDVQRLSTAILASNRERPTIPVTLNGPLVTGHRKVTLSWKECEADTVLLSIWSRDEAGKPDYTYGCCNEVHAGAADTLRVVEIPKEVWEAEHYVSVTPVRRLPAEAVELSFIPAELPNVSAIEAVTTEDTPEEEPQYYTLTGLPIKGRPQQPGLYLRRTARRTEKIHLH